MSRVLVKLRKGEPVKYISHLDVVRTFEHALRRARVPVTYSAGFNPRPKMSFARAVGVGVTSDDERIVLELATPEEPQIIKERLNSQLPAGIEVLSVESVPAGEKSPLVGLNASEFRITATCAVELDARTAAARVDELLAAGQVNVVRKRRTETREVDIRPYILGIDVAECSTGRLVLTARLQSGDSGGARPQDLVAALRNLAPDLGVERIHRVRQYKS